MRATLKPALNFSKNGVQTAGLLLPIILLLALHAGHRHRAATPPAQIPARVVLGEARSRWSIFRGLLNPYELKVSEDLDKSERQVLPASKT